MKPLMFNLDAMIPPSVYQTEHYKRLVKTIAKDNELQNRQFGPQLQPILPYSKIKQMAAIAAIRLIAQDYEMEAKRWYDLERAIERLEEVAA